MQHVMRRWRIRAPLLGPLRDLRRQITVLNHRHDEPKAAIQLIYLADVNTLLA